MLVDVDNTELEATTVFVSICNVMPDELISGFAHQTRTRKRIQTAY